MYLHLDEYDLDLELPLVPPPDFFDCDATWENESNLKNAPELLQAFYAVGMAFQIRRGSVT